MPMQWNDQADARLFANVLKLHVVKLDYIALAKAMGNTVTPKAISHRISKIKDKANAYRRDNPYAFDPDDEPIATASPPIGGGGKRKKGWSGSSGGGGVAKGGKGAKLFDDEEPRFKMEHGGVKMELGLGLGLQDDEEVDAEEVPMIKGALERIRWRGRGREGGGAGTGGGLVGVMGGLVLGGAGAAAGPHVEEIGGAQEFFQAHVGAGLGQAAAIGNLACEPGNDFAIAHEPIAAEPIAVEPAVQHSGADISPIIAHQQHVDIKPEFDIMPAEVNIKPEFDVMPVNIKSEIEVEIEIEQQIDIEHEQQDTIEQHLLPADDAAAAAVSSLNYIEPEPAIKLDITNDSVDAVAEDMVIELTPEPELITMCIEAED